MDSKNIKILVDKMPEDGCRGCLLAVEDKKLYRWKCQVTKTCVDDNRYRRDRPSDCKLEVSKPVRSLNKKKRKELWMVFEINGEEKVSCTVRGTFHGEKQETINLLAAENGVKPEDVKVKYVLK